MHQHVSEICMYMNTCVHAYTKINAFISLFDIVWEASHDEEQTYFPLLETSVYTAHKIDGMNNRVLLVNQDVRCGWFPIRKVVSVIM